MKKLPGKFCAALLILVIIVSLTAISASAAGAGLIGGIASGPGNLDVRSSPSSTSPIVKTLPGGSYITLIYRNGDWWYAKYSQGQYGYCAASSVTPVAGTYSASVSCSLNIRSGPGTSYNIIGWLNNGDNAVLFPSQDLWKKIIFNGCSIGYVNGSYLNTTASYIPVSLNVPSYKQTDPRWANAPVGTQGGTIGTIGCATVSLAMTESYRTGTSIYPSDIVKTLSYTPGGAVYWPSNYTSYTGADYLNYIYSLLEAGKPVIIGSKDAYGNQHWVVVTGFSGGSALTASDFAINDPGSNVRTTLQQYMSSYPNFYKIMYY